MLEPQLRSRMFAELNQDPSVENGDDKNKESVEKRSLVL
jgi:hypothetical protein